MKHFESILGDFDRNKSVVAIKNFEYDVALSFAGENRKYVESVARCLKERGLKVFYDKYEKVTLWGKDLYVHLDTVYRERARFCVIFISKYYKKKLWTNHEMRSAQARAFTENKEYILPARFDDTEIPGLRSTIGYIPLKDYTPSEFTELVIKKVGLTISEKFLPLSPNKFFEFVGATTKKRKEEVRLIAEHLIEELSLMNNNELKFIYNLFIHRCPSELPHNIHINLAHFERLMGMKRIQIEKIINNLENFGFSTLIKKNKSSSWSGHKKKGKSYRLEMEVYDRYIDAPQKNVTIILKSMIDILNKNFCEECAKKAFLRLDFILLE
jgi:hypothetical protein